MKHKRRFERIRKMIVRMQPIAYEVVLPDWNNPDLQPLTTERIEEELKKLEPGCTLHWAGVGSFYCYAKDSVITLSRARPALDYLENMKAESGE